MRETILNKANEMFLTLGFKSVTMDDIASELGISKKTIYQHYSNKNELVEASVNNLFETIATGIDTICTLGYNSIEEIYKVREFMSTALNNETVSPFFQLHKFFPKVFTCLRKKQFEKLHDCMLKNITNGIDDGLFRSDIDPEFTARMYFTGLTGIKDSDIFPAADFEMQELTGKFIEYHLRSIVTAKGFKILSDKLTKI